MLSFRCWFQSDVTWKRLPTGYFRLLRRSFDCWMDPMVLSWEPSRQGGRGYKQNWYALRTECRGVDRSKLLNWQFDKLVLRVSLIHGMHLRWSYLQCYGRADRDSIYPRRTGFESRRLMLCFVVWSSENCPWISLLLQKFEASILVGWITVELFVDGDHLNVSHSCMVYTSVLELKLALNLLKLCYSALGPRSSIFQNAWLTILLFLFPFLFSTTFYLYIYLISIIPFIGIEGPCLKGGTAPKGLLFSWRLSRSHAMNAKMAL
jgi:hypothetical protein